MKNSTDKFKIQRFLKVISTDVLSNAQNILLAAGSLSALLIFILLYFASIERANQYLAGIYGGIFLIAGLTAAGMLFGELSNRSRSFFYVLIPAAPIEKFLSKLIIVMVLFPVMAVSLFFVIGEVSRLFSIILFEYELWAFNPISSDFLKGVKLYYIVSPVFVFGSVYFNGQSLLKTIVSTGLTLMLLYLLFAIEWKLLFWDYSNFLSIKLSREYMFSVASTKSMYPVISLTSKTYTIFSQYIFAPFMIVLSYIALREREI